LNGVDEARVELELQTDKAISFVTWLEVMDAANPTTEVVVKAFLGGFTSLPMDEKVVAIALKLRKVHKITFQDAIVWATAQAYSRILVTRDTNFADSEPGIRIPYKF
ncbi:PIN domain-containing protein, partial [Glaciimonas sp. CA11.2]